MTELQAIDINPGCHPSPIQTNPVFAPVELLIKQDRHLLTQSIVDSQANVAGRGNTKRDVGFRIKWIGKVLFKNKRCRDFLFTEDKRSFISFENQSIGPGSVAVFIFASDTPVMGGSFLEQPGIRQRCIRDIFLLENQRLGIKTQIG